MNKSRKCLILYITILLIVMYKFISKSKEYCNLVLDMAGSNRSESFVNLLTDEQIIKTVYVPSTDPAKPSFYIFQHLHLTEACLST